MILVQALITALLSGLFSGGIIFALNERRDRNAQNLAKIEECVSNFSIWIEKLSNWPGIHFEAFVGDREVGRARLQTEWREIYSYYLRSKMLQEIYLPSAYEPFLLVLKSYESMFDLSREIQKASIENKQMPDGAISRLSDFGSAIIESGSNGREALYAAARQHAHAPFLVNWPSFLRKS